MVGSSVEKDEAGGGAHRCVSAEGRGVEDVVVFNSRVPAGSEGHSRRWEEECRASGREQTCGRNSIEAGGLGVEGGAGQRGGGRR